MTAKISARCDPGSPGVEHTLADVLGTGAGVPQPLAAEDLGAYCSRFGGDGSVDTLQEWIDCLVAVNSCAAQAAIAAHYPRALEWLPLAQTAMGALAPPPADALAALAAVDGAIDATPDDALPDIQCGGGAAVTGSFPATGQTTCWDSSGSIVPCAGTGHDGDVQAGAALAYLDNGDGTITDLNTGLMWEKKSDDGSINDKDNTHSWDDADAVHVAGLNTAVFAGYSDWRVPNVKELVSISNYESTPPAVDSVFNTGCAPACTVLTCSCTSSTFHRSSTTQAATPLGALLVNFANGIVIGGSKADLQSVRAVRGGL